MKSKTVQSEAPTAVAVQRMVRRLKRVSEEMRTLGETMDYYGGFGKMGERGREMIGAARLAKSWIKHMEKKPGHCPNCGNPYYRDKHNGDNKRAWCPVCKKQGCTGCVTMQENGTCCCANE